MGMASVFVIAAQGDAGPLIIFLFLIFCVVLLAIGLWADGWFQQCNYDVVIKGGAPYCPNCNRQVSYRRDNCRSCGYQVKTYGPTPTGARPATQEQIDALHNLNAAIDSANKAVADSQRFRAEAAAAKREADRLERQEARDAYYIERGVEPGRMAWFRVLPDWGQAVLMGLAIPAPIVIIAVAYAMSRS